MDQNFLPATGTCTGTGAIALSLKSDASKSGHRRLLVCAGDDDWCQAQAVNIGNALAGEPIFFIGAASRQLASLGMDAVPAGRCSAWLGREHCHIIFDAHRGFDVDAFGAISGTLCAGGLLVLLTPRLDRWHQFPDPEYQRIQVYPQTIEDFSGRYLQRLAHIIGASDQLSLLTQDGTLRMQPRQNGHSEPGHPILLPYQTLCQQQAVEKIHRVLRGHRRRPLVLTADRGRGKSTALGIAAAQLLLEGVEHIAITAPSKKTTEVLFKHARMVLEDSAVLLHRLAFFAPDELTRILPTTQLLLVDEAAAIPTPLLATMLTHYSRVVYATTVHGYEGTGRGFALRFRKILDKKTPHWHELRMSEPVRWQAGDPLESFVFNALLLNAVPHNIHHSHGITPEQCTFREILQDELLRDENLLSGLFGLLVLAHYQTRPLDLRHLLDSMNMAIYGCFDVRDHLLAVLLAAREGHIEPDLRESIWLGRRRVRGHILPQSLSNHLGIADGILPSGLRIIRIAVHPHCQRMGFGRMLLDELQLCAQSKGIDYLGTLFGATNELLNFWGDSSFAPVRVGLSRDAASGAHSVMMLRPLSVAGSQLVASARQRFMSQFPWLLTGELQDLDGSMVAILLSMVEQEIQANTSYALSEDDQLELFSFVKGQRQYENCICAVRKAVMQILASSQLPIADGQLLVGRVLQNHPWRRVVDNCRLSGEKQARQSLRTLIRTYSHVME